MKSEAEIKSIIYTLLQNSPLKKEITGVITKRKRPLNSSKEDIVISVLASKISQLQPFILNVNLYVKDVKVKDQHEEDSKRVEYLSKILIDFFESTKVRIGDGYMIELQEQRVFEVQDKKHHCINNKLLLTNINE